MKKRTARASRRRKSRGFHYDCREENLIVGLMSGTSADGLDIGLIRIRGRGRKTRFTLEAFETVPYSSELRQRLIAAASGDGSTDEIARLNMELGIFSGESVRDFLERRALHIDEISCIASHGHTVRHLEGATLQIGDISAISDRTGIMTAGDFRTADVARGGCGAPFAPVLDWVAITDESEDRLALNIGGISNITLLPRRAPLNAVTGFDTGPGNMLVDLAISDFSDGKLNYDRDGEWGRRGSSSEDILIELLSDPYFSLPPPKSTGREHFGSRYYKKIKTVAMEYGLSCYDIVRTLEEFTARSIFDQYSRFISGNLDAKKIFISGGGAFNPVIMSGLRKLFGEKGISVHLSDELGMPAAAKETILIALLAHFTLSGYELDLSAITGARRKGLLGKISPVA